jgi:hypothetical protein
MILHTYIRLRSMHDIEYSTRSKGEKGTYSDHSVNIMVASGGMNLYGDL